MEIELEVAAASANEFLKRPSPERIDQEEARQETDGSPHDDAAALIPQLTLTSLKRSLSFLHPNLERTWIHHRIKFNCSEFIW